MNLTARPQKDEEAFRAVFDRSADYGEPEAWLMAAKRALAAQSASDIARTVKRRCKELDAITQIDFFPNQASNNVQAAWSGFDDAANPVLSSGEPHAAQHPIVRLDRNQHQGRTWASRCHLWADRLPAPG